MFKHLLISLLLFSSIAHGFTFQELKKANGDFDFKDLEINSFLEAHVALEPLLKNNYAFELTTKPMSLEGELFIYRFKLVQVMGKRIFLLAADTGYSSYRYFVAYVDTRFKADINFVDDRLVTVIGYIKGTESYTTVNFTKKTVPKIKVLAIQ